MKVKTSVSISEKSLAAIRKIAARDDRSVSYVIEKFIEQKIQELPEESGEKKPIPVPAKKQKISYSKRRSSG
jgi:hypothetical protein